MNKLRGKHHQCTICKRSQPVSVHEMGYTHNMQKQTALTTAGPTQVWREWWMQQQLATTTATTTEPNQDQHGHRWSDACSYQCNLCIRAYHSISPPSSLGKLPSAAPTGLMYDQVSCALLLTFCSVLQCLLEILLSPHQASSSGPSGHLSPAASPTELYVVWKYKHKHII